jgi:hypothetical protein
MLYDLQQYYFTNDMKIFIKILTISLLALGCQNSANKDKNQIKTFNLKELLKIIPVKLTDLGFVDIMYIPLETTESNVFSCTNNFIGGGKLIVGDKFCIVKCANDILMFKDNGLFERKIGTVGRGPNEFMVSHDVQVDEINQEIYLLAGWQKKFFVYSIMGDLIRTFQIPFFCNEFNFVENGILCYSENHMADIEKSYTLIDSTGKIIKSFSNKYPFSNHDAYVIQGENLFYHFNNQVYKKEVYSDTIYLYKNGEFKPSLAINVGDKLITQNARSQFDGQYLAKNFISPLKLFELGNFVYYEFIYKFNFSNTEIYSFIGSKNSDFQVLFNTYQGIINDIDGGPNILPKTTRDDNTIIALLDALQLKKHIASEEFKNSKPKYPEKKKDLEKLASSLKETDNPVLMLVRLKK